MVIQDVKSAIRPLRLVFWGLIIALLFEFRFSWFGLPLIPFDLFNGITGAVLFLIGSIRLSRINVSPAYSTYFSFIKAVAILDVLISLVEPFDLALAPPISYVYGFSFLLSFGMYVMFCMAMREFCQHSGLSKANISWKRTLILNGIGQGYLVVVFNILMVVDGGRIIGTGESLLTLIGIALAVVGIIHLGISIRRMENEAIELLQVNPFHQPKALKEQPLPVH